MSAQSPCDCGCCSGVHPRTPGTIENRSGLSAISYRIGTHARFRDSLLAGITSSETPLTRLKSRDPDDFSIALIDAWACAADVLTFYQERIANESYLRTATETLSLVELARLIGYELQPGVAASAWLAFTIDESEGGPEAATVPRGSRVQSIPGQDEESQTFETDADLDARRAWNTLRPRTTKEQVLTGTSKHALLEGIATDLKPGDPLLVVTTLSQLARVTSVVVDPDRLCTRVEWGDAVTLTPAAGQPAKGVYAMRVRASLFAHNAPDRRVLDPAQAQLIEKATEPAPAQPEDWTFAHTDLYLDALYPTIQKDSLVVLMSPAGKRLDRISSTAESGLTRYTVSGPSTKLALAGTAVLDDFSKENYRATSVFAASEFLPLAEEPASALQGGSIGLDRRIDGLPRGRALIVRDPSHTELAFIDVAGATADPAHTRIDLKAPLRYAYDPNTVSIFANVVGATHGESVREVLGSGDGTESFQRFALKQPPLTHVSAKTERGTASTLSVFVNDTRWSELPTLFGAAPTDRAYIARRDSESGTTVQFGDGISGSRLPSGSNNVRVEYRKGIGRAGLVRAGQLALLMTQPFGVSDVINPLPSEGARDAETLAEARGNTPRTVLTLDRVVSLLDYQNFARTFGSIAKSLATWTRAGAQPVVFLTVAGQNGATVDPTGALYRDLASALRRFGNPNVPLRIVSYRPAFFRIQARVGIAPDHVAAKVMAAVKAALQSAFSFDARDFAQAVDRSEVFAVIQRVDGVAYVDVDRFFRADDGIDAPRLIASPAKQLDDGTLVAAELLMLDAWDQQDMKELA